MANLPSQPVKDSQTSFSLFNWLRNFFNWAKPISDVITVDNESTPMTVLVNGDLLVSGKSYLSDNVYILGGGLNVTFDITTNGNIYADTSNTRYYADFSNATVSYRHSFQTNVTDGATSVGAIPNGTSTTAAYNVFSSSDPTTASSYTQLYVSSTESRIYAGKTGSGAYLPLNFYTNGTKQLEINTSGKATFTVTPYVGIYSIFHEGNRQPDLIVHDTRSTVTTPETTPYAQVRFDFKQNSTEGLSDGNSFFGEISFRKYGYNTDWSGGPAYQLGITDNKNLWIRSGSNTTWSLWKKLNTNYHHVESYGAKGDGTTDDTAAIQAAIDAALNSINGSKTVIFEAKTYKITSTLLVNLVNGNSIRLQGEPGKAMQTGSTSNASGTLLAFAPVSSQSALAIWNSTGSLGTENTRCFFSISDINLTQTNSTASCMGLVIGSNSYQFDGYKYSEIKNVNISAFTDNQLHITRARALYFENCLFTALGSGSTNATAYIKNDSGSTSYFTGDLVFHSCDFVGSGTVGQTNVILYSNSTNSALRGLHFTDCNFYYGETSLYLLADNSASIQDIFVDSCQFDGANPTDPDTNTGINLITYNSAKITGVIISHSYFVAWDNYGIYGTVNSSGTLNNINICNNYIGLCETNAINMNHCQGLVVSNNTCFDCGPTGSGDVLSFNGGSGTGLWVITGNTHRNSSATRTANYVVALNEAAAGNVTEVVCTGNVGHCATAAVYDILTTANKTVSGNWRRA